MAGRDNVLFMASVANGTAAGTVIPLSLAYGIENVRQGYGTPRLKSVQAYYGGIISGGTGDITGIPVFIKNSNWIDEAGLSAQKFPSLTALDKHSLSYMRGRDKVLQPNTSWTINAILPTSAGAAGYIFVILDIEYSDVPGINTENAAGSPVMKVCSNASVTAGAATPVNIGSFDNLLQGTTYVMSEVSAIGLSNDAAFVIVEGFSNQKGLTRIFPAKASGLAEQIEGSVYLTKQTYNISVLSFAALSAAPVSIYFEMIASNN